MAYNNLSGSVLTPNTLMPRQLHDGSMQIPIVSGNLSTSDGAEIINIPRVSNAINNSILTNVGGDANTFTCEGNLTFDGSSLDVVGDIEVSNGAILNGPISISSSLVAITGSIVPSGSNTHSLGSAENRWKELFVGSGSIHIGSNGASISSNTFDEQIEFNCAVSASMNISASSFYGDGSNLVNVKADNVVAEGPVYSVQFHDSADGDLTGSSNLLFQNNVLSIGGGLTLSRRYTDVSITASVTDYYIGIGTTNNPVALTLPSATLLGNGQTYVVKDEGGASNINNITILASGEETIDNQNSIVLESPYASIQLYCNGSNKFFIC